MNKKLNFNFIFILLAASLWGTSGIFIRNLKIYNITEMQTVFWRGIISSAIFAVIMLIKDKSLFKIKLKDIILFLSAGIFSVVLFNFSYFKTMSLTSLSVAAVLLYTAPFFVVIISALLFSEKLTLNKTFACVLAFIGCCFVAGLFGKKLQLDSKALIFGLLTGFGYGLYTVFTNIFLKKGYSTLTITFYIFLSAGICSIPFVNITECANNAFKNPMGFLLLCSLAVFITVIPYILYTVGLRGVEASAAPIIATVELVVATIIGRIFFEEKIGVFTYLGIALVFIAVALLNKKRVSVKANAKINLSLAVTGVTENGYHTIDTVMHPVTLADRISVFVSKKLKLKCNDRELENEENIVIKAANLFFEYTGVQKCVKIHITKQIPKAAGIGGASADAAAVLLALDRLFNTDLSTEQLEELGLKLGADVPFFITNGAKRAGGIGEKLSPVKTLKEGYFLLLKTEEKPSTAEMYKRLDNTKYIKPDIVATVTALENGDAELLAKSINNSFACVWQDSQTKKILEQYGSDGIALSGSGPTWFAYFTNKGDAVKAYKSLKKTQRDVYLVKPCEKTVIFE